MKKHFSALTLFLLLTGLSINVCAQQNVILLIADDLGTDYLGFSDNAKDTARVPNIRSLVNKGIRFQNAWATPVCSPTRAGILTGRYSFRTGVGTAITGSTYPDLDTTEITLAQLLKYEAPVSYATANIGKWHLNQQTPQKILYPHTVFGYDLCQGNFLGEITDYYNYTKITNGVTTTVNQYATTETINDAINWLDTLPQTKPFFLWIGFNAPHSPFHLPPDTLHSVPNLTGTQQHINQNTSSYFKAMIEAMDTETGRLLQWLVDNNRMDSTNIIFVGDNGQVKKVSQISDTSHAKGSLYEYGVYVPMVVSGPAVVGSNRVSQSLVSTTDLFATVAEMAGFGSWQNSIPNGLTIDSRSLVPILRNQTSPVREWIFTEMFTPGSTPRDGKAIRNEEYKLISFDDGHLEFYNLTNDQDEQLNLLTQTLSSTEQINFDFLCNELANLVGSSPCITNSFEDYLADETWFKVFPSVTYNSFFVESGELLLGSKCGLYNSVGQKVMERKLESRQNQIDVANLVSGLYFVKVNNLVFKILVL